MPAAADTTGTQKEPPVAKIVNRSGLSKIVLICEHASKRIPGVFGDLGLTEAAKISHAAWDIGAQGLAEQLSATLDAVLVLNTMSRLIYDCNRAPIAPDAMPAQSEKIAVPGNRGLSNEQKLRRIKTVYEPFHSSVQAVLDSAGPEAVLVTVHSFTSVYNGLKRATEIGLIHHQDDRLAKQMVDISERFTHHPFSLNQPYSQRDGVTHMLERHGTQNAIMNVMIEVRNDLIDTAEGQHEIAIMLAKVLNQSLQDLEPIAPRDTP